MASTTNRVLFFVMLGVVFAIFFLATRYFYSSTDSTTSFKRGGIVIMASIIFSLFFVGYVELTGLIKKDVSNFCPSPGPKLCRGGPYMWQGDSERAKYCRKLAATPEGEAQIKRYECGKGMIGMPGCGFKYTPMSDDCWRNQRCDSPAGCDIESNGIF